jgi:hypothetical protein
MPGLLTTVLISVLICGVDNGQAHHTNHILLDAHCLSGFVSLFGDTSHVHHVTQISFTVRCNTTTKRPLSILLSNLHCKSRNAILKYVVSPPGTSCTLQKHLTQFSETRNATQLAYKHLHIMSVANDMCSLPPAAHVMTRHDRLQKRQKGMSEDDSRGLAQTKRSYGSIGHKVLEHSSKSAAVIERVPQRAEHSTSARNTRNRAEAVLFHGLQDRRSDQNKVNSYLQSCDAMHLLDNIPGVEHVHFVDQSLLPHARPKKLLVGHHVKNGHHIYAYVVPLNTLHRVELYIEHARGHSRLNINREGFARHRILYPFNTVYPRGARNTTQTDKARLELVVKWYFVASGVVEAYFPDEAEAFSIRFCNALRYIANQSDHVAEQVSHRSSMQQPPRIHTSRKRRASSVHPSEDDIQSYLLQQYLLPSRAPSAAAPSVQHATESRQVATVKKTGNAKSELPKERRGVFDKVQAGAHISSETGRCSPSRSDNQQHTSLQVQDRSRAAATVGGSFIGLNMCRGWCDWMKDWLFNVH